MAGVTDKSVVRAGDCEDEKTIPTKDTTPLEVTPPPPPNSSEMGITCYKDPVPEQHVIKVTPGTMAGCKTVFVDGQAACNTESQFDEESQRHIEYQTRKWTLGEFFSIPVGTYDRPDVPKPENPYQKELEEEKKKPKEEQDAEKIKELEKKSKEFDEDLKKIKWLASYSDTTDSHVKAQGGGAKGSPTVFCEGAPILRKGDKTKVTLYKQKFDSEGNWEDDPDDYMGKAWEKMGEETGGDFKTASPDVYANK